MALHEPRIMSNARSCRSRLEIEAKGGKVIHPPQKLKQMVSPGGLESSADLHGMILTWEPDQRASAEEMAKHPWFDGSFPEAPTAEGAPPLLQF